ncbi:hypothetical protein QOT17_003990 [Balamuthia mandrillaris]
MSQFSLDCQNLKPKLGLDEEACRLSSFVLCKAMADHLILWTKYNNFKHNLIGPHYLQLCKLLEKHECIVMHHLELIGKEIRNFGVRVPTPPEMVQLTRITPIPSEKWPSELQTLKLLLEDQEIFIRHLMKDHWKVKDQNDTATSDFLEEIIRMHKKMAKDLRAHLEDWEKGSKMLRR